MVADGDLEAVDRDVADTIRHHVRHAQRRLETGSAQATEQMISLSKWLTASLLALNGAGALFTMNALDRLDYPLLPAGLFAAGLLLSMGSGVANQSISSRGVNAAEPLIALYNAADLSGQIDVEEEILLIAGLQKSTRYSWLGPILGWVSALAFAAGSISLGADVATPDRERTSTCRTLAKDMLSRSASRSDSRENFTALGCARAGAIA